MLASHIETLQALRADLREIQDAYPSLIGTFGYAGTPENADWEALPSIWSYRHTIQSIRETLAAAKEYNGE
jgi:hypothetical protein